jgi:bacillithiol system protein YtxJ
LIELHWTEILDPWSLRAVRRVETKSKPMSQGTSGGARPAGCGGDLPYDWFRLSIQRTTRKTDALNRRHAGPILGGLLHWFHMHPDLTTLEHVDELHRLLAESETRPVLLFKHSHTCGVSLEALDELVSLISQQVPHRGHETATPQYVMVTVQTHRAVSNAIAHQLGVRHETPQALLIKDGRVVWSASHFRVTAAAVESALRTQS